MFPILAKLALKGFAKITIKTIASDLSYLNKHCTFSEIEETVRFILMKEVSNSTKNKLFRSFRYYLDYYNFPYDELPYLKTYSKNVRVPLTSEINTLINGAKAPLCFKLMLAKETGMRPIEVATLLTKNIDTENRKVYPVTAKYGAGRTLIISKKLSALLKGYITKYQRQPNETLFRTSQKNYRESYMRYRKRTAEKLDMPQLKQIRLYDFRHYFATQLYARTKDILYVKQQMGHRCLESTMVYTHLLEHEQPENYTCKTAKTTEEAVKLIEAGFEKADEFNGIHIFRKRK